MHPVSRVNCLNARTWSRTSFCLIFRLLIITPFISFCDVQYKFAFEQPNAGLRALVEYGGLDEVIDQLSLSLKSQAHRSGRAVNEFRVARAEVFQLVQFCFQMFA